MFGRNRKFQDEELGELSYQQNSWSVNTLHQGNDIFVSVEGTKDQPFSNSLNQVKGILKNINNHIGDAKGYLDIQDISQFKSNAGEIIFEGISSSAETGKFDLHFGLSEWEDAFIIVHFHNNLPKNISLGD